MLLDVIKKAKEILKTNTHISKHSTHKDIIHKLWDPSHKIGNK